MRTVAVVALTLLLAASPAAGKDRPRSEGASLLEGVRRIALPGVPGTVTVFGPRAFPVVTAPCGGRPAPLVAATRHGDGRAVPFGHGYFGPALRVGDTARLVANVLRWTAGDAETPRVGVRGKTELREHLADRGFVFVDLGGTGWTDRLDEVDVAVLPLARVSEDELTVLTERLEGGLGIVAGMPGWGWQQLHPKQRLATDNMANRLLAPAGLVWGADTVQKPSDGVLEVGRIPAPLAHAGRALAALSAETAGSLRLEPARRATAVAALVRAIGDVPPGDELLLPRLQEALGDRPEAAFHPSRKTPLTDEHGLARVLLAYEVERGRGRTPADIEAHPAAATFPGPVPAKAPRVRRTLRIDTAVPDWHGTGLYAAPGEVVTLTVPKQAADAGFTLRMGAHKDRLWNKPAWHRVPEITRSWPVRAAQVEAANAFGGLLYVVVPRGAALGVIEVTLEGAVEAPRFVLGETTNEEWLRSTRAAPAPWAELETRKVILTVPSSVVRKLDDPEALLVWWDRVMDGCADLAAMPRERARPERYVTDVQISAGYMHAGYPIMTHLDAAPRFVDLEKLSTKGDWGMFHEMGHNHQRRDWTFAGTGEVTVNLFSLYLMETVCKKGVGHRAMSPESIAKNRAKFLEAPDRFALWKRSPFLALIPYYELKRAFGWDAYKKVFAEYRDLPKGERPRGDDAKRDQWLTRMSRTVGRNLGPFFESWSIPTSAEARAAVADLPAWMPE